MENLQTGTSTTKYELGNLYGNLNKQDHGELPLRITGSVDDRDELQQRNRQTVYCTVWTMTPHVAQQRASRKPCPGTAPVNLQTVLWSMPAMKTGILGLKTEKGTQREGHQQVPANQASWSIPAVRACETMFLCCDFRANGKFEKLRVWCGVVWRGVVWCWWWCVSWWCGLWGVWCVVVVVVVVVRTMVPRRPCLSITADAAGPLP